MTVGSAFHLGRSSLILKEHNRTTRCSLEVGYLGSNSLEKALLEGLDLKYRDPDQGFVQQIYLK